MKKLMILFAAVFALGLSGCKSLSEVQRRVVVHAIGIDPTDGGYEVSYQIFTGGGSEESGPVDASESTVATLLAQGRTLYEAEESLRLQTGKEVFLGDAELIVINKELAGGELSEFLKYFRRSDVYLGVNVVYCEDSAKKTIGQKLGQNSATAILLRGVVESAIDSGRACSSRIIELSNALDSGETLAVPVLTVEKSGQKKDDETVTDLTLGVFNSLLMSKDGCLGSIDENAAIGIRLLRGDLKRLELTVNTPGGMASVSLSGISIKRRAYIKDGLPLIKVCLNGKYDVTYSPEGVSEREIASACADLLVWLGKQGNEAALSSGGDLFKTARLLKKYKPKYYEAVKNGGGEEISGALYEIEARLSKY